MIFLCLICASKNKKTQMDWALKRSEEHTSELQSQAHLVCRLLHEKNYYSYCDFIVRISCLTVFVFSALLLRPALGSLLHSFSP